MGASRNVARRGTRLSRREAYDHGHMDCSRSPAVVARATAVVAQPV